MRHAARIALLALCVASGTVAAETAAPHPLTGEDLAMFFDALLQRSLHNCKVPGAVVTVVRDGQVLFSRGYGYADTENKVAVDPAATTFRVGSITKIFTWTAVMQLVGQGKLDLDADVNRYLDFKVGDDGDRPVTLRQLMTHTAGFAATQKNIVFLDPARAMDNAQFLKHWIPPRIHAPGTVTAYSNYGAALAGYIVERVSGQPYEQYIERNILKPLGMAHSSLQQPPDAAHAADGYGSNGMPQPAEIIAPAPAGGLNTSGLDMARFMIAQLQGGRIEDMRILDEDAVHRMHATAFTAVPPLNGMGLGFLREDRNGQAIAGHGGGTMFFFSNMHLLLDQSIGLFIAMNGPGVNGAAARIREDLLPAFMDRYFPMEVPQLPQAATALEHGQFLRGAYEYSQRSQDSFGAFISTFHQAKVSVQPDGALVLDKSVDDNGQPRRWREVAPWLWQENGGPHHLAAKVEAGRIVALQSDDDGPASVWQPVPLARSAAWNLPMLLASQLVLLFTTVKWLVLALLARQRARYSRTRLASAANLLFISGLLVYFAALSAGAVALNDAIDPVLRLFQCAGVAGALLTPFVLMDSFASWRNRAGWWQRCSSAAVALACAVTVCIGYNFGLYSSSLNF